MRMQWNFLALALLASVLAGCASDHASRHHHGFSSAASDPFAGKGSPYYHGPVIPFGGGAPMVGKPYAVAGQWFTPHEQPGYDKTGVASWYGEAFHRRRTSNGEWFDMNTLTAAHATLPLPSYVIVTNLDNDRQVVVRVNDRGPFVNTRVIDLSKRAADVLGYRGNGTAHVRVKLLGPAPIEDSMGHMLAMNNALNQGASNGQLEAMAGNTNLHAPLTSMASNEPQQAIQRMMQRVAQRALPQAQATMQQATFTPPQAQPAAQAYVVRVGVFHDVNNANEALRRLASFGPARIVRGVGANGPLYRVEMGPLDNKPDADAALITAIGAGYEDAKLVAADPLQISMN